MGEFFGEEFGVEMHGDNGVSMLCGMVMSLSRVRRKVEVRVGRRSRS